MKPALRRAARWRRRAMVQVEALANAAAEAFDLDPRLATPVLAGVYLAAGSEIDPSPLVRRLRARGSAIALPAVVAPEAPLAFRRWSGETTELPSDLAGRPAPPETALAVMPDLVVAPLLAFDARGGRLGQGGGHYDRTLAALRRRGRTFALGLAFAEQEIDEVPQEPHDQRLDGVLTERGLRLFAPVQDA